MPLFTSEPARINNFAIDVATKGSSLLLQAKCKGVRKYLSLIVSGFTAGNASNSSFTIGTTC